jgi:hypothetical protein
MVKFKWDHAYCQFMAPFSDKVEVVHEVGPNTGQHWAEEGRCWCQPTFAFDNVPGVPHKVRIWFHKKFKPNWG